MRRTTVATFILSLCAALTVAQPGHCAPAGPGPIHLLATIQIPGNPLEAFDISWVDPATRTYYLADRSNAGIDIIDTRANTFIARIEGFAGNDKRGIDFGGPNGVLVIPETHQAWAGDGNSKVRVIDLEAKPPKIIQTIDTHGTQRADELAYDPKDHLIMVANNADEPAFVSFISTRDYRLAGIIRFADTKLGIEQSVWDPVSGKFYLAIPAIKGANGEVVEIDPLKMKVTRVFKINACAGSGLALGPDDNLLQGCWRSSVTVILNRNTGATTLVSEVGGSDEVWFNPGDNRYYLGAGFNHDGPVLGVIDARTNRWLQNVRTTPWAHSVAADAASNHVFVPLTPNTLAYDNDSAHGLSCAHGCIGVFGEK